MKLFVPAVIFLLAVLLLISTHADPYADKKLIEYGWDVPSTQFVHDHIAEMEKAPFDGVVMKVMPDVGDEDNMHALGWRVFSKQKITLDEYEHAIADLKATKFTTFTDNFIQVIAFPGNVDWFDPGWSAIAYNAARLAEVAKLGGCKGIMFDPEHYNQRREYHIWNYKRFSPDKKAAHSFRNYALQVKERGKEFMRAINAEYPDITILTLYGPSLPYLQAGKIEDLEKADYGLLAAFYDGMCEAATSGATIVDGYESSYGFKTRKLFQDGRKLLLESSRRISTDPKAFTDHIRAGFGIYADKGWPERGGWHSDDFSKNYWTPESLRASLAYALESSDRYVWIYSEELRWWNFNVPAPYQDALALSKKGPGPGH